MYTRTSSLWCKIYLEYEENKKIGYVPQFIEFERSLPITVEDFLMLCYQRTPAFLGVTKKNKSYFDEILTEVGLQDKRKKTFR